MTRKDSELQIGGLVFRPQAITTPTARHVYILWGYLMMQNVTLNKLHSRTVYTDHASAGPRGAPANRPTTMSALNGKQDLKYRKRTLISESPEQDVTLEVPPHQSLIFLWRDLLDTLSGLMKLWDFSKFIQLWKILRVLILGADKNCPCSAFHTI